MTNASTISNNIMTYEFITKKKQVISIAMEDSDENPEFSIHGPKEIMSKLFGGLGENDGTNAWINEKNLKTEAQRMFAVLEITKMLQKGEF